jgi:hypothetical protein
MSNEILSFSKFRELMLVLDITDQGTYEEYRCSKLIDRSCIPEKPVQFYEELGSWCDMPKA